MLILYVILTAAALLGLLFIFIWAPGICSKKKKAPFFGRNIAHRGLFSADQSVPENSLAGFAAALAHGYGVELDVQLTKDGKVVVFHDDALKRMCSEQGGVDEFTFDELQKFSLKGTDQKIPLFSEVLSVLDAKVPVIVELKNGKRNRELCEKTLALLNDYAGEYCIESFNPFIVKWFRFHAPRILRGQLSQPPEYYRKDGYTRFAAFLLGTEAFNFLARPNFSAYRIGRKPLPVRFAEKLGCMRVAWTSHDCKNEKDFDVVIFEHYLPQTRYKQQRR